MMKFCRIFVFLFIISLNGISQDIPECGGVGDFFILDTCSVFYENITEPLVDNFFRRKIAIDLFKNESAIIIKFKNTPNFANFTIDLFDDRLFSQKIIDSLIVFLNNNKSQYPFCFTSDSLLKYFYKQGDTCTYLLYVPSLKDYPELGRYFHKKANIEIKDRKHLSVFESNYNKSSAKLEELINKYFKFDMILKLINEKSYLFIDYMSYRGGSISKPNIITTDTAIINKDNFINLSEYIYQHGRFKYRYWQKGDKNKWKPYGVPIQNYIVLPNKFTEERYKSKGKIE